MVKTFDAVVSSAGGSTLGYDVLTLHLGVSGLLICEEVEVWAAVGVGARLAAYIAAMAIITTRSGIARMAQGLIEFCPLLSARLPLGLRKRFAATGWATDAGV